jgi:hypothetical protein
MGARGVGKRAVLFSDLVQVRALCYLCSSVRLALVGSCVIGPYVPEPMMRTGRALVLAFSAAAMVAGIGLTMLSLAVGSGVSLQLLIRVLVVLIGPFAPLSDVLIAVRLPLSARHGYQALTCAAMHAGLLCHLSRPVTSTWSMSRIARGGASHQATIRAARPAPPRLSPVSHTHTKTA